MLAEAELVRARSTQSLHSSGRDERFVGSTRGRVHVLQYVTRGSTRFRFERAHPPGYRPIALAATYRDCARTGKMLDCMKTSVVTG